MQPLSGNQRRDLLTALMNMSLVLRLPREMHLAISSAYVPRLPSFLKLLQNAHVLPERTKVLPTPQFFRLLTSKCASRHNGAHFFDISASKSGPNLVCFAHFDLEMCFATQRRALFRHLNVQKCSEPGVFCTFDLEMCFAPQQRATFHLSSDQMCPFHLLFICSYCRKFDF